MSELGLSREFAAIQTRTRRFLTGSMIVHIILLLWLILHQTTTSATTGLTEITWVDAAALAEPEPAAPPIAERETKTAPTREVTQALSREETPKQFKRELTRAAVEPKPQSDDTFEDVMAKRLESLQRKSSETTTRMSALVPPPKVGQPSLAGVEVEEPVNSAPSDLKRSDAAPTAPTDLKRVSKNPTMNASSISTPVLPDEPAPTRRNLADASASRELAGAKLVGPVADRELVSYETPVYPEWAKRDGVEGSVTVYFLVLPNGRVKDNVLIDKTSGFSDFDKAAVKALKAWQFEKLPGSTGEQWGKITFHFRLTASAD